MARRGPEDASWWRFATAGVVAGIASGMLRPDPNLFTVFVDSGAAVVLASMHALGLLMSERLRWSITA